MEEINEIKNQPKTMKPMTSMCYLKVQCSDA